MSATIDENISTSVQQKIPFYINRNYAFLWGGQAISNLGDLIFGTTLTLWIVTGIARGQTWAPLATGSTLLCASVPTFLVGPLAGVFVDRWNKQRTMISMDVIRALLVALLLFIAIPFLPGSQLSSLGKLVIVDLVLLLTTICSLFFGPARLGIIQEVIDEKQFEQASGLAMLTQNISRIIGPSLAAPTLFVFGVQWALLINAVSFLISAFAIRCVPIPRHPETEKKVRPQANFWSEFGAGLLFFAKSRILLVILAAFAFITIRDAAEQTLGIFFMLSNLHIQTYMYGLVGTAGGIGGILGALVATSTTRRIGTIRSFWIGIAGFGLLLFLFSRMTAFLPALVFIFLAGFPAAAARVAMSPLLLRSIPRELLGRVNAVFTTCISVVSILSISIVGILASTMQNLHTNLLGLWFGPYDTILSVSGLLTILIGFGVALSLRNVSLNQQKKQEDKSEQKEVL